MDLVPIERGEAGPDASATSVTRPSGRQELADFARRLAGPAAVGTLYFLPGELRDRGGSLGNALGPALISSLAMGTTVAAIALGLIAAGRRSEKGTLLLRLGALVLVATIVSLTVHGITRGAGNYDTAINVVVPVVAAAIGVSAAWFSRPKSEWQLMLPAAKGFTAGLVGSLVGGGMLIVVQPLTFASVMVALLYAVFRGLVLTLLLLLAGFALLGFSPRMSAGG